LEDEAQTPPSFCRGLESALFERPVSATEPDGESALFERPGSATEPDGESALFERPVSATEPGVENAWSDVKFTEDLDGANGTS